MDLIEADKVIKKSFSAAYMNNTKWYKLIEKLTDNFETVYLNYKLIYNNSVKGHHFDTADFEPFFLEPILYKEIEWIEIPSNYESWVSTSNRKAGKKLYHQDLNEIKSEIDKIGNFELDVQEDKIRLYAYK